MSYNENEINCWICKEKMDEPTVKYCDCAGYISNVHYDCLANWNIESNSKECRWCERKFYYIKKVDYLILLKLIFENMMTFIFLGSIMFYWVMISVIIKYNIKNDIKNINNIIIIIIQCCLILVFIYNDYIYYKENVYNKSIIDKLYPIKK